MLFVGWSLDVHRCGTKRPISRVDRLWGVAKIVTKALLSVSLVQKIPRQPKLLANLAFQHGRFVERGVDL